MLALGRTRSIIQAAFSGKTTQLLQEALFLLHQGNESTLLILASNATQVARLKHALLTKLDHPLSHLPVYTFSGWVRTCLFDLWPLVLLKAQERSTGTPKAHGMPELIGFQESSLLLKKILLHPDHALPEALRPFIPSSPDYLIPQLIRRWRLRCEQSLNAPTMRESTQAIIQAHGLPPERISNDFLPWLHGIEHTFIHQIFETHLFDPATQLLVFERLLGYDTTLGPSHPLERTLSTTPLKTFTASEHAQAWMQRRVRHLLVDDLQDALPSQVRFISWLQSSLETWVVTSETNPLDGLMASRTQEKDTQKSLTPHPLFHGGIRHHSMANTAPEAHHALLQPISSHEHSPHYEIASECFKGWFPSPEGTVPQKKPLPDHLAPLQNSSTPSDMMAQLSAWMTTRLQEGSTPSEWLWILPQYDDTWSWLLTECLTRHGIPFAWLQRHETLSENRALCRWVVLLRLLVSPLQDLVSLGESLTIASMKPPHHEKHMHTPHLPFSLPMLLEALPFWLHSYNESMPKAMPQGSQQLVAIALKEGLELPWEALHLAWETSATSPHDVTQGWLERFQCFYEWLQHTRRTYSVTLDFESMFFTAFQRYQASQLKDVSSTESAYEAMLSSYRAFQTMHASQDMAQSLTLAWLDDCFTSKVFNTDESVLLPEHRHPDSLWITTPQHALECRLRRAHVVLLDLTNPLWCKRDHTQFYHAWLMSARWPAWPTMLYEYYHPETTPPSEESVRHWVLHSEGAKALLHYRAAHQSYALALLVKEKLWCFSTDHDLTGQPYPAQEHLGTAIAKTYPSFLPENDPSLSQEQPYHTLTPRPDQAKALLYQGGAMAIQAVPGAGKTFTSIALLVKLIRQFEQHTPETPSFVRHPNCIWVVTYMESAAQTLRERLKRFFPHKPQYLMPQISTLHALALRILKQSHRETPSLMDPLVRQRLLQEVARQTTPEAVSQESWHNVLESLFSRLTFTLLPLRQANPYLTWEEALRQWCPFPEGHTQLPFLAQAWNLYHHMMEDLDMVDFDHLIASAVLHLEHYPDTKAFFQTQCQVVIEDEAQDSSDALQTLLHHLLGSPHLVRIGDTNQSITTTFTSATTDIFRAFTQAPTTTLVQLAYSSRSALEIQTIANTWLEESGHWIPESLGAFQPATLCATEDNPSLLTPIAWHEAETLEDEVQQAFQWIHTTVLNTLKPPSSKGIPRVAILCRTRERCDLITQYLRQLLTQQPVGSCATSHEEAIPQYTLREDSTHGDHHTELSSWFQSGLRCIEALALENVPLYKQIFPESLFTQDLFPEAQWNFDWYLLRQTSIEKGPFALLEALHRFLTHHTPESYPTLQGIPLFQHFQQFQALQAQLYQPLKHLSIPRCESTLETLRTFFIHVLDHQAFQLYQQAPEATERVNPSQQTSQHCHAVEIHVMTVHKSKGQEFPLVLLMGCDHKQYPMSLEPGVPDALTLKGGDTVWREAQLYHRLAQHPPHSTAPKAYTQRVQHEKLSIERQLLKEKLDEECRLVYVALSRAEQGLWMSYSRKVSQGKRSQTLHPARWWNHLRERNTHQASS
ncbi:MAG: UvrD-helicase domain-containing protein [Vampirovibrionales bacterium]